MGQRDRHSRRHRPVVRAQPPVGVGPDRAALACSPRSAPFCTLSFLGLGLSTLAVSVAAGWAAVGRDSGRRAGRWRPRRANVGTFGTLWVVQYLLLDRVLFAHRAPAPVTALPDRSVRAIRRVRWPRVRQALSRDPRLRLVIGLVVLLTVGLALFGVRHLRPLRALGVPAPRRLRSAAPSRSSTVSSTSPPAWAPPSAAGRLPGEGRRAGAAAGPGRRSGRTRSCGRQSGTVLATISTRPRPRRGCRRPCRRPVRRGALFTVGSASGSGEFRVLVVSSPEGTTVIAVPTTEVTKSLHQLVLIEAAAAAVLLLVLSAGSWLILRRGLRPLERMAGTARSITAGDLSQRVSRRPGRREVGELGLALNTMLDDIEEAFKQQEETERRLRQFLADASHELRTPLTSIQGFAELFRLSGDDAPRRPADDPPAHRGGVGADAGAGRGPAAARPARPDRARPSAAPSTSPCSPPTRAATPSPTRPTGRSPSTRPSRSWCPATRPISARRSPTWSPTRSGTRRRGRRSRSAPRSKAGQRWWQVRDHGAGLDDEALAHVFDRFWQADKARSGTGAGLGLAIVASIAGEHAGTVTAANAPDGGAVFTLRLPLDPERVTPRLRPAAHPPEVPGGLEGVPRAL